MIFFRFIPIPNWDDIVLALCAPYLMLMWLMVCEERDAATRKLIPKGEKQRESSCPALSKIKGKHRLVAEIHSERRNFVQVAGSHVWGFLSRI